MILHVKIERLRGRGKGNRMKELLRTNDIVLVSYIEVLLREQGIEPFVLDTNASVLEGSLGILPRRIAVIDEDYSKARTTLHMAGLKDELGDPQ